MLFWLPACFSSPALQHLFERWQGVCSCGSFSGTSQALRKNCQSSSVSSLGDVNSQNLLEEKELAASSRHGWPGLFSVKLMSLPGPESLCFSFWCSTRSLGCSLCNLSAFADVEISGLEAYSLKDSHPLCKEECRVVLAAALLGILTVFYTFCVKTVALLKELNLLAAFVFDVVGARKENHLAVISLIQSGEAHLQNLNFHHQA